MCPFCWLTWQSPWSHRVNVVNSGINHREGWRAGVAVALCLALCELVGCVATVEHLLRGRPCIGRTDLVFSTLECCVGPVHMRAALSRLPLQLPAPAGWMHGPGQAKPRVAGGNMVRQLPEFSMM